MIVPLLYKVTRKPLPAPSVLLRSEVAKDAELLVLRHENEVRRRQLAGPVRYEPAGRFRFAALPRLIHRPQRRNAFPITPGTLLDRHHRFIARKWDHTARNESVALIGTCWTGSGAAPSFAAAPRGIPRLSQICSASAYSFRARV